MANSRNSSSAVSVRMAKDATGRGIDFNLKYFGGMRHAHITPSIVTMIGASVWLKPRSKADQRPFRDNDYFRSERIFEEATRASD